MQSSLLFTTQGKHVTLQDVVHSIRDDGDDGCGSHNKDDIDDNDDYGRQMGSSAFCGHSKRCCRG